MNRDGACARSTTGEWAMKKLMAYLKDESGQTSTEYILLVAVVAMIVFKFKKQADSGLSKITDTVFGKSNELAEKIGTD
jgi:pilus assembly protein Flp/PilA